MKYSHQIGKNIAKISVFLAGSLTGVMMFFVAYGGTPILFAQQVSDSGTSGSSSNIAAASGVPSGTPVGVVNADKPVSAIDKSCADALPPLLAQEKTKFINFMNQQFKNEAPNSQLLGKGLMALANYKSTIVAAEKNFMLQSKLQTDAIAEVSYCDGLIQKEFSTADAVFQSFVQQTTYSKKATALTEKINSINGKLRNLLTLTEQFDSYFVSFSNHLPGFVEKSCTK